MLTISLKFLFGSNNKMPLHPALHIQAMAVQQAAKQFNAEGKKIVIGSREFQARIRKIKALMNKK